MVYFATDDAREAPVQLQLQPSQELLNIIRSHISIDPNTLNNTIYNNDNNYNNNDNNTNDNDNNNNDYYNNK